MSDSENDLFPSNMYSLRQESSTISVKGPNINKTLTNTNFRNNMLSSTMMSKNFGRQGFCEPSFYQNTMHNRRELSPMSLRSVPAMHRSNYNESYSQRNNFNQRSVISGRGASPMSVRSFDSNASISAIDIAMAFKNAQFNKYDMRIIKVAYDSFMKSRSRRRIEKRRKKRFRCERRQSHDSGEQGSNSSESSDDCRSIKSTTYKYNASSSRSTRTDLSNFKQSLKESNIYRDCSDSFRHSTFKNTFPTAPKSINGDLYSNTYNHSQTQFKAPRSVCSESHIRNASVPVLKDRFNVSNNFLLPSQRFKSSVASKTILENSNSRKVVQNKHMSSTRKMDTMPLQKKAVVSYQTDSDEDVQPIEGNVRCTTNKVSTPPRKRALDTNAGTPNSKKRNKNTTPKKTTEKQEQKKSSPAKANNNDFEFVKPAFPIRKPLNGKTKETLISKSVLPPMIQEETISPIKATEHTEIHQENDNPDSYTSNVSMRPSFIKRKLFSQKLDVTEAKNPDVSPDSPQVNSYNALMKEKSKARKVVANQSCLSRDTTVNNNLLDLIHKIVPRECMNMTNQTNVTNASVITKINDTQNEKDATDPDKWDVTSVISTCNKSNVSDTFTDEEIFNFNTKNDKTKNQKPSEYLETTKVDAKNNKNKKTSEDTNAAKSNNEKIKEVTSRKDNSMCKFVTEKLSNDTRMKVPVKTKDSNKVVNNYVDNFFETDYETDSESRRQNTKAVRDVKVVIEKPAAKPSPQSKTPLQKKNAVKKLTPVPSIPEVKKKPGLKNYFQRILKGKNKENVAHPESLQVDITENKSVNEVINNNNYVDKVKQIQDIVKKASTQTKPMKISTTKKDEVKLQVVDSKTVQDTPVNESILNNTRSRRVRTPRIQNVTLNIKDKLNKPKQKQNKTIKLKDVSIDDNIKTQNEKTPVKNKRGRPQKAISSQLPEKPNTKNDSNLSLNNSMTLRARNKQNNKNANIHENNKKTIKTTTNIKVADNVLNTSMTLRCRKPQIRNTSYVY